MRVSRGKRKESAGGMTMIELMLAIGMLATGLVGVLALMTAAIGGNSRNKTDTSGIMLAQMVTDKIMAQPAHLGAQLQVSDDCSLVGATNWQIATLGSAAPGSGANLVAATGGINWLDSYDSVPAGYKMRYVACGINNERITYELRWNIQIVNGYSKMVTVGARAVSAQTGNAAWQRLFARPVTLRTIVST